VEKGEKWCKQCGRSFKGAGATCDDECREERLKQRQRSIQSKMTILRRTLEAEKVYQRDDRLMYSENFIESVLAGGCVYCGMDGTELAGFTGICLDRIRNDERGKPMKHNSWNVCGCCPQCNSIKSDLLSIEEMALLHEGLVAIRVRRGNLNAKVIESRRKTQGAS
jgi:predicted nucleic acid-binding Zn ribbon protein